MAAFAPEIITNIGAFPVTNTLLNTILVDAGLLSGVYYLNNHVKKIPGYFQNTIELVLEGFYDLTSGVAGKKAKSIFPWFMSFFLFILLANWSGLIPGIGTFGFYETVEGKKELVPLIRNATSDLNTTFGLALISLIATHVLSVQSLGWKEYLSRYFSYNPVYLYVGILEIIGEFTKIISLSFRLFGNIFAGEVVLSTISSIFAFLFPIPFLALEIIVGLVQALVFSMLTMVFMSVLMTPHHAEEHTAKEVSHE
jgi:F-type H+-transporting ATPase subunit a